MVDIEISKKTADELRPRAIFCSLRKDTPQHLRWQRSFPGPEVPEVPEMPDLNREVGRMTMDDRIAFVLCC